MKIQEKILTEQVANAVNDKCLSLYDTIGASAVIAYGDEIGLDFENCIPCNADMPCIKTDKDRYCAVCGS
jgi:hypothetical protein